MKFSLPLLLLIAAAPLWSQSTIERDINAILLNEVTSELEPGIAVGVVQKGRLIYQNNRGSMNLEYGLPINDSTLFDLASVTKQFTAACIGILAQQGRLSIYDDVRKYIPELAFYGDTIRVQHLLNHTSGIRNHNVLLDLKGFDYKHRGYTNEMIQELMFLQQGVNNAPGERMLYSNTNYVLLALIVERVSGRALPEFADQEIFRPLGMSNSFYRRDLAEIIENRAYPHYKSKELYKQPKSLTLCLGAGGMMSNIQDLAKWSMVFLRTRHQFYFLKEFLTELDTLNNGERMKHARGMFVSPYRGYKTYNHSGRDLGSRSQFICLPALDLTVIVLTNSEYLDAVDISYQILDLFIPKRSEDAQEDIVQEYKSGELKPLVGIYQELNSDLRMEIFIDNDSLRAISSLGNQATPLTPVDETVFARADNAAVTYSFFSSKTDKPDLQVDFGGATFYFESVQLEAQPNEDREDYLGEYYSAELDVTYSIQLINEQLVLSYPNNEGLVLQEGVTDTFGANRRTKYAFKRNDGQEIVSFTVSAEGTVKNILFERL